MEIANTETPLMKQYRRIKSQLPDNTILFFRLGDFYEMFYEDAKIAAPILDVALTKRQHVPMCGVPYHAADMYLARLIKAGKRVAVCDQLENPALAKGIVKRDVTSIVTPGTAVVESVLDASRNNYLAALFRSGGTFGLALLDLSTGAFQAEEAASAETLRDTIRRYAPSECAMPSEQAEQGIFKAVLDGIHGVAVTKCEDWIFDCDAARDALIRHFSVHSLEGFGCEGKPAIIGAAGGALYYVKEQLRRNVSHVRTLRTVNPADYLVLDEATCANLDLLAERGRNQCGYSLLKALDCTKTAMGSRMLRDWLLRPLADAKRIVMRHDAVERLCSDRSLLRDLREALGNVRDIERLIARLGAGSGNARDLRGLVQSLRSLPAIKDRLSGNTVLLLDELARGISLLPELANRIDAAIVDEPPAFVTDGGMIRRGYNQELDELRDAASAGRNWLAEFQAAEQRRTGIKTLKVRHNKVFGYYIEVSRGQSANVPAEYIRKQTLVNAERFVTPEIKEYEQKIMGAQDKATALEYEIFTVLRDEAVAATAAIQATADSLARLDVLAAFAERALLSGYTRPVVVDGDVLEIKEGRHPVVELMPDAERFVPNDTMLDCDRNQLLIITGPNMAGKSTYIRQVALIIIMAQAGSFAPASGLRMSVVDRVFTRVGASDDLARGRSTFMVEMQETANILNNATPRSLIVLDEIGRGTSTFDGISIAWAVAEYLHGNQSVKAKTLFATHYHELTDLALTMPGVKNYNVLVREKGDSIVFLRRIVPGAADKSYGIQVAKLAGLPVEVVERAREILLNLEDGEFSDAGNPKLAQARVRKNKADPGQLSLFG